MNATEYTRIGRKGVAAGAMLLTGALLGYTAAPDAKSTATGPAAVAAREAGAISRTLGPATHSYANVVEAVTPAVVTVRSEHRVRQVSQQVPDDLLREFFGGRGADAAAAAAARRRARLRRDRARRRLHPHEPPRDRRRRAGDRGTDRWPQLQGRRRRIRCAERPRRAEDRRRQQPADAVARQLRCGGGRRRRARRRQSARRRPDRDDGHRQREGPRHRRHELRGLHPDRRADQPGQFRRRAGQHRWRAGGHQLADPVAVGRQHRHRLLDSGQHGAQRHDAADRSGHGASRHARRDDSAGDVRHRAEPRPRRRCAARWSTACSPTARRRGPA